MGAGLVSTQGGLTEPQPELNLDCCWQMVAETEPDLDLNSLRTCRSRAEAELDSPSSAASQTTQLPLMPPGTLELNSVALVPAWKTGARFLNPHFEGSSENF